MSHSQRDLKHPAKEIKFSDLRLDIRLSFSNSELKLSEKILAALNEQKIVDELLKLSPKKDLSKKIKLKTDLVHFRKKDITKILRKKGILSEKETFLYGIEYQPNTKKLYLIVRSLKSQLEIGKGSSGYVKLLQDLQTNNYYVRKTVIFTNTNLMENNKRHVAICKKIYGEENVSINFRLKKSQKMFQPNIYKMDIFMPYFQGKNLDAYMEEDLNSESKLRPDEIILAAAKNLKILHDQGIIHRDISSLNILVKNVDNKIELTILDFNNAVKNEGILKTPDKEVETEDVCLSRYADPRIRVTDKGYIYSTKNDVYSLILLLFQMLYQVGKIQFINEEEQRRADKIFDKIQQKAPVLQTKEDAAFISKILAGKEYPTLDEFIAHLNKTYEATTSILKDLAPSEILSPEDLSASFSKRSF